MRLIPLSVALAALAAAVQEDPPRLRLEKGDRVCIVGNTLAERMQHDGWLETLLHARFPAYELVIRNLGFSGDEVTTRLRSSNFGTPDQHLAFNRADVVLAFFGYNESFGGAEGLEKFTKDLGDWADHVLSQKYNGRTAPRLALLSPVAHEDHRDPNLPDGRANNARLELYSRAIAQVARARRLPFVDLLRPSARLFAESPGVLTLNGIHLTEAGNRALAPIVEAGLFPEPGPARDTEYLEKVRAAVLDKNFHWFHRHRATDGYSTYGGRADLKFVEGQTNRVVLQRELEILDAMTATRDRRVWAAAQGRELAVDDSNTPDFVPVKTNKPGAGPGGGHVFLGGEAEISKMQVARGMKVNLYASEEMFPELANPVQMAFDPRGRLWVAAWPTYPHWKPKDPMNDKLLILEDLDGDGKADRCKTFAGDLHNPTGFDFWGGGVIVAQGPDVLFLKDTDGDDRADLRERVVSGVDTADTHHTSNSFVFDPGGAVYFQEGTFHHTQVETPWGPPRRVANGAVFRYEPRAHRFDVYVTYSFANPHGHVFDRWGRDFVTDGTTEETYDASLFSGHLPFPRKHAKPARVFRQRTRPCGGTEILSSRHFPDEMQGDLLLANVIGFLGVLRYKVEEQGSGFSATEMEPILQSSDPNFRPVDLEMGPDGAIYLVDWQNPIIGHMQHNLRDPSRDKTHGRVYRVRYLDRPLLTPPAVAGQPIEKLLDLLREPEDRVRYRARAELGARKTAEVLAAARNWIARLDRGDREYEHHLLEGLWLHQNHNVVDAELLNRVLRSPDPRARTAATRVLRAWRDRLPNALDFLRAQANDEHPRVRLEAVVAASDSTDPRAAGVALECLKHTRDEYLDFVLKETMAALDTHWKAALREGRLGLGADNPAAAEYLLGSVTTAELLKLPRTPSVLAATLTRPGVGLDERRAALRELARARGAAELTVLLDVITAGASADVGRLLVDRPAAELRPVRERLVALARQGKTADLRRIGYAGWMSADGSIDPAYAAAAADLRDFLGAAPLLAEPRLREALYPKIRPLLSETSGAPPSGGGVKVDYFDVAPRNVAVETLEALKPKASGLAGEISLNVPQIQRRDAFALRFTATLAAPKGGKYTFYTSSDDGSRLYVDGQLVVNNDGFHGMSEKSGTANLKAGAHALVVTYFDQGGGEGLLVSWDGPGFGKEPLPARALGGEGGESVADAAFRALAAVPGRDAEKFADLAALILSGKNRAPAIRAARQVDRKHWPREQARPLVNAVLAHVSALPVKQRTLPPAVEALQFGQEVADLLPAEQARQARAMLKNVGVTMIVVRPVPHQMVFDRRKVVVEAGKPVEILFENIDIMPHNLVVTSPGAMAEVGEAAEKLGTEGEARHYVPDSPKVLWATKLVFPGQSERLQFTAPRKTGSYPYVCTFPGHWLVMNGVMQVVESGAASALSETEPAPASARAFVKMWTLKELEADANALRGRSFARGKEMFTVAGCVKCHALGGEGSTLGPELAKVAERFKGRELLAQILEPSGVINEQFRATIVFTNDGDSVVGVIAREDDRGLHVVANLLDPNDVTVVPKANVRAKKASELSLMPTGLLTTLRREEILDLVAYLESGADPSYKAFK